MCILNVLIVQFLNVTINSGKSLNEDILTYTSFNQTEKEKYTGFKS